MTAAERAAVREAINQAARLANPVSYRRCPVHGRLVACDGDGKLIGRCDGCAAEAARALTFFSGYSTRDGGHILGDRAVVARRDRS